MYNDHRRAKVAVGDATTADFDELFNEVELGPTLITSGRLRTCCCHF